MPLLEARTTERIAGRELHRGLLRGRPVVLALAGIGKVAAAVTATLLLARGETRALLFTGTAGGLGDGIAVGDIVIARDLLQHDLDASPLFPRFEVPLTGRSRFAADPVLNAQLADAGRRVLAEAGQRVGAAHLARFGIRAPRLHEGLVVSGDRFVSTGAESAALRAALPDALAVEMEGAAVAQACAAFDCPFAVVRTVSDRADDLAHVDFPRFVEEVASVYTRAIVEAWLEGTE